MVLVTADIWMTFHIHHINSWETKEIQWYVGPKHALRIKDYHNCGFWFYDFHSDFWQMCLTAPHKHNPWTLWSALYCGFVGIYVVNAQFTYSRELFWYDEVHIASGFFFEAHIMSNRSHYERFFIHSLQMRLWLDFSRETFHALSTNHRKLFDLLFIRVLCVCVSSKFISSPSTISPHHIRSKS